ncbi:lipopolysaccharide biosynthesis protein [Catenuloplanes indicus]|uniref:O-antigen/teichoic acid export membrane protein n=1 Tax=Catenuloplanes indicus TaxID=137267 RepID=A0AAE3W7I4_9ACTN|nr:lipopolysaccharide biosynthesis protein [Catenuloplanes indicus]MDQ0371061.1 O-antigen/teichoic acid export membrane protein [Catenuloplanes indicus]
MSVTTARRTGARSSAVGLAGAAVSGLFGFLLAVVLARGFGSAGAGAIFAAVGLLTVACAVCCLGADTGLVWALPRRALATAAPLLTVALAPPLALGLLVAAGGLLLAGPLAGVLLPDAGPSGVRLLSVASAALPLVVAMTVLLSAVRASRPITAYAAVQFGLLPVGRPVAVGAVALAAGGVVAALIGWVLPVLLALVACVALLYRPLGVDGMSALRPVSAEWRPFWSFALPRAVSAAIDSGSMWVGVLLTSALATATDAGVFGGVGRYVLAGQLALQGLRVAVAPQLSRLLGAGRIADAAAVHRQTTVLAIALSWPVYLLLALFAPAFLALFGGDFGAGGTAMAVLSAAMLVNVGLGTVQTVLLMSGHSRRHLAATSAGLACTVGFGLWWIPAGGVLGAAAAWAVGIVVENVAAAIGARQVIGGAVVSRSALLSAAGSVVAVVPIGLCAAAVAGRGLPGLLLACVSLMCGLAAAVSVRRVRELIRGGVALLRDARSGSGTGEDDT